MGEDSYYDPPEDNFPDERNCWNCDGSGKEREWDKEKKKWKPLADLDDCQYCGGSGKLDGPLTREEKDMAEAAYEDAMEAKAEARREKEFFDRSWDRPKK